MLVPDIMLIIESEIKLSCSLLYQKTTKIDFCLPHINQTYCAAM